MTLPNHYINQSSTIGLRGEREPERLSHGDPVQEVGDRQQHRRGQRLRREGERSRQKELGGADGSKVLLQKRGWKFEVSECSLICFTKLHVSIYYQAALEPRRGPEGEGDRPLGRRGGLPDALRRALRAERQPAARAGQAPQGQVRERHGRQRGPGVIPNSALYFSANFALLTFTIPINSHCSRRLRPPTCTTPSCGAWRTHGGRPWPPSRPPGRP